MPLPNSATKAHLDEATDDPRQARAELADLVDKFNALLTFLGLSTITSTPATVGEGLEISGSALRAKLNGTTLLRSASGLSVNAGAGANQIVQLDGSGALTTGTVAATVNATQQFRRSGVITPSQITADQNDYAPTNIATASRARISSDAARSVTGIVGGAEGRELRLTNVGSFTITLKDADTGSAAANRFAFGDDFELLAGKSVNLFYDDTSDRWMADDAGSSAGVGVLDKIGTSLTISNTASETSLYSVVVPANSMGAHGAVRLTLRGFYRNNTGAGRTMVVRVNWGGSEAFSDTTVSIPTGAESRAFTLELLLSNRGNTGSQDLVGRMTLGAAVSAAGNSFGDLATGDLINSTFAVGNLIFDTTSNQTLGVTITHSAASSSLLITRAQAIVELL